MLNRIIIQGRLVREPELRYTQSQTAVAAFTVAVDRDFTDQSGSRATDFIDCVAWRQGGEFVSKYFHKGDAIVVEGRLQSRKWQDRDGNKRQSWEILSEHTYFGGSKRDSGGQPARGAVNVAADEYDDGQAFTDLGYGAEGTPFAGRNEQGTLDDLNEGDLPF